ncbi:unnamed protein product [Amoebophrya sp. A25]|nr:unnamed protein product [Amoebophrya sp. A25]|eukprot:GSA25T00019292001.1
MSGEAVRFSTRLSPRQESFLQASGSEGTSTALSPRQENLRSNKYAHQNKKTNYSGLVVLPSASTSSSNRTRQMHNSAAFLEGQAPPPGLEPERASPAFNTGAAAGEIRSSSSSSPTPAPSSSSTTSTTFSASSTTGGATASLSSAASRGTSGGTTDFSTRRLLLEGEDHDSSSGGPQNIDDLLLDHARRRLLGRQHQYEHGAEEEKGGSELEQQFLDDGLNGQEDEGNSSFYNTNTDFEHNYAPDHGEPGQFLARGLDHDHLNSAASSAVEQDMIEDLHLDEDEDGDHNEEDLDDADEHVLGHQDHDQLYTENAVGVEVEEEEGEVFFHPSRAKGGTEYDLEEDDDLDAAVADEHAPLGTRYNNQHGGGQQESPEDGGQESPDEDDQEPYGRCKIEQEDEEVEAKRRLVAGMLERYEDDEELEDLVGALEGRGTGAELEEQYHMEHQEDPDEEDVGLRHDVHEDEAEEMRGTLYGRGASSSQGMFRHLGLPPRNLQHTMPTSNWSSSFGKRPPGFPNSINRLREQAFDLEAMLEGAPPPRGWKPMPDNDPSPVAGLDLTTLPPMPSYKDWKDRRNRMGERSSRRIISWRKVDGGNASVALGCAWEGDIAQRAR